MATTRKRPRVAANMPMVPPAELATITKGTWTPNITDSSGNSFDGVTVTTGAWERTGNEVTLFIRVGWTGKTSVVGVDVLRITGLPFTNSSKERSVGGGNFEYTGLGVWPANAAQIIPEILQANTYLKFFYLTTTGSSTSLFCSQVATSGQFRGTYKYTTEAD